MGGVLVAKYHDIAAVLAKKIVEGDYRKVKKLPTEKELMEQFQASRNTIRSAISLLSDQGYTYQVRGSGIYIKEINFDNSVNLNVVKGMTSEFREKVNQSKLLELKSIEADQELAELFGISKGDLLYYVKRIRYLDKEPIRVEMTYYRQDIIPYLGKDIVEHSIYDYLTENLGLQIGFADRQISADYLSEEHAGYLKLGTQDPCLRIKEKTYLTNGQLFAVATGILHFQKITLFASGKVFE